MYVACCSGQGLYWDAINCVQAIGMMRGCVIIITHPDHPCRGQWNCPSSAEIDMAQEVLCTLYQQIKH